MKKSVGTVAVDTQQHEERHQRPISVVGMTSARSSNNPKKKQLQQKCKQVKQVKIGRNKINRGGTTMTQHIPRRNSSSGGVYQNGVHRHRSFASAETHTINLPLKRLLTSEVWKEGTLLLLFYEESGGQHSSVDCGL